MAKKKSKDSEWIGGVVEVKAPGPQGTTFEVEVLVWLELDTGLLVGQETGERGTTVAQAGEVLRRVMLSPLVGPPRTPSRIRVAPADLAQVLMASHPELEILRAPTPELAELAEAMKEDLGRGDEGDEGPSLPGYLEAGLEPAAIRSFFGAAAFFARAKPLQRIPEPASWFSVDVPAFERNDRLVLMTGREEASPGLIFLDSPADLDRYIGACEAEASEAQLEYPPHMIFAFRERDLLSPDEEQALVQHRWPLADDRSYPQLIGLSSHLEPRAVDAAELAYAEVLLLALTQLAGDRSAEKAWQAKEQVERSISVASATGTVEVIIRSPADDPGEVTVEAVLDALFELESEAEEEEPDLEAYAELEEELLALFLESPEAEGRQRVNWLPLLFQMNGATFGTSVLSMGAEAMEQLLMEEFPRAVSVGPELVPELFSELQDFYRYLLSVAELPEAEECLALLDDQHAKVLTERMADPTRFGPAKAAMAQALEHWSGAKKGPTPPKTKGEHKKPGKTGKKPGKKAGKKKH